MTAQGSSFTFLKEIFFCINSGSLILSVFWDPQDYYLKIIKHNVVWHFTSDDFSPKNILIVFLVYAKKMKCLPLPMFVFLEVLKKSRSFLLLQSFINNWLFKFLYDATDIILILTDK